MSYGVYGTNSNIVSRIRFMHLSKGIVGEEMASILSRRYAAAANRCTRLRCVMGISLSYDNQFWDCIKREASDLYEVIGTYSL